MAILFRQTNAVWVAFTLAVCLLEDFLPLVDRKGATDGVTGGKDLPAAAPGIDGFDARTVRSGGELTPSSRSLSSTNRRKNAAGRQSTRSVGEGGRDPLKEGGDRDAELSSGRVLVEDRGQEGGRIVGSSRQAGRERRDESGGQNDAAARYSRSSPFHLLVRLAGAAVMDACRGGPLLRRRLPLAIPVVLFAVFVWGFNGGAVVVGDKENHSPGGPPHLAQLAYLVAVGSSLWGFVGKEAILGGGARRGFLRWVERRGLVACASMVGAVALALWRWGFLCLLFSAFSRNFPWLRCSCCACKIRNCLAWSGIYVYIFIYIYILFCFTSSLLTVSSYCYSDSFP